MEWDFLTALPAEFLVGPFNTKYRHVLSCFVLFECGR